MGLSKLDEENKSLKDRLVKSENEKLQLKSSLNKFTHGSRVLRPNPIDEINKIIDARPASSLSVDLHPGLEAKTEVPKNIGQDSHVRHISADSAKTNSTNSTNDSDRITTRDPDGTKRIKFLKTGTTKVIEMSGVITVKFQNGDVKTLFPENYDQKSHKKDVYYYADSQTTETTFYDQSDKSKIVEFSDNQIEHYFKNGNRKIFFPDKSNRTISDNGFFELAELPDGTKIESKLSKLDGTTVTEKKIFFTNGQIEEHNDQFRRRIFTDGTVKTIFNDGHQETRYPNKRLRIKDRHGNVVIDRVMEN